MSYTIKWKRANYWFWRREKVMGHSFNPKEDIMTLYYKNGSIKEIRHWGDCDVILGKDWFDYAEAKAKKDAKDLGIQLEVTKA